MDKKGNGMIIITNRHHNDSLPETVKSVPVDFMSNQIGTIKHGDTAPLIIAQATTKPDTSQKNKNSLNQPLVSCIMPTHNRRFFIKQSIKYFLNQDYENKELIIIDDGDDSVSDIIPDLANIFYYKYDIRLTIGEKRNIGCEKANGDLIAHWDDDDWFSNQRLSIQIKYLLDSQSDICGLSNLYYYSPSSGSSWLYTYRAHDAWIAGGTFVYKRDLWKKNNFSETNQAEDSIFLSKIQKNKILTIENKNLYIGIIHTENTSAKHLDDPAWSQLPLSIVSNLFAEDRDFYVDLRKAIVNRLSFTFSNDPLAKIITKKNNDVNYQQVKPVASYPLVSCIMPTSNRAKFVRQSINYFLRQTYPNIELVIVDDGDNSVEDLIPDDSRIKYIKLSSKYSIGKKRNLACEVAEGDIIMCWDDDDWHGPERIEQQISPLLNDNYDVSGIGSLMYYSLIRQSFYVYQTEVFKDGIVGGTLTFWKRLWDEGLRFKNMSLAEDVDLQNSFKSTGARIKPVLAENIFFIVRHDKNTWNVGNSNVKPIAVPEYIPLKDLEFYEKYALQLNASTGVA